MTNPSTPMDVLCVGATAYDLVFSVPEHPGPDVKTFADDFYNCGGGPAANAAVLVSRHGCRAAFSGYLGKEIFGDRHYAEFQKEGVLLDYVVRGTEPTPLTVILVKPDGRRALINYSGDTGFLPEDAVDFTDAHPKVILFDGHQPDISLPLARTARRRNIPTILDAGSVHRGTRDLLPLIDYCICSEKFAFQYTGVEAGEEALDALNKLAPNIVITLGARGLLWKNRHGSGSLPAFKIDAIDTTGAGDAFHGAFAVCLLEETSWQETLHYASAAAAVCCTIMGARPSMPTRQQVLDFLKDRG